MAPDGPEGIAHPRTRAADPTGDPDAAAPPSPLATRSSAPLAAPAAPLAAPAAPLVAQAAASVAAQATLRHPGRSAASGEAQDDRAGAESPAAGRQDGPGDETDPRRGAAARPPDCEPAGPPPSPGASFPEIPPCPRRPSRPPDPSDDDPVEPGARRRGRAAQGALGPALVIFGAAAVAAGVAGTMAWATDRALELHALRLADAWRAAVTEVSPALPLRLASGRLQEEDLAPLREAGARADAYAFRLFARDGAPVASGWSRRGGAEARAAPPGPPGPAEAGRHRPPDAARGPRAPGLAAAFAPGPAAAPGSLDALRPDLWPRLAAGETIVELAIAADIRAPTPPGPVPRNRTGGRAEAEGEARLPAASRRAETFAPLRDASGKVVGFAEIHFDVGRFAADLSRVLLAAGATVAALAALGFAAPALAWLAARRRRMAAEDGMRSAALRDPLTGLPNRQGFAAAAWARLRARRPRGGAPAPPQMAVIVVDLDRFRAVNDQHGAATGDAVLRATAGVLRGALRGEDVVARMGPDDFAALARLQSPADLAPILARLAERLAEPRPGPDGRPLTLTASLGACLLAADDSGVDGALRRAEIALSEARAGGPGRARIFEPEMEARLQRRRRVEAAVRDGVVHGRFSMNYQPLVRAADGGTFGFEALMRLRDAAGQPIPPAEFIPVAEDLDLIAALGAWALHEATSAAAGWPADLSVSVNLSVAQFRDGRLADTVRGALEASGLAAGRLELEVTESLLISDPEAVERQLDEIRALGCSIAMDDFGVGYSSLAYLWRHRFDRLKLDRGFLRAFDQNSARARGMIGGIVALARRLGLKVTAEGVETQAQAAAMTELGCDALQGYRFGRPMTEAQLAEVMRWEADAREEPARRSRRPPSAFAVATAGNGRRDPSPGPPRALGAAGG